MIPFLASLVILNLPILKEERKMELHATGTFEVQLTPHGEAVGEFGPLKIDKTFSGEMVGTSIGIMLGIQIPEHQSAGYVALERVTASLQGKSGSFVLQHSGSIDRGEMSLSMTVVPDSGTGDLTGLRGELLLRMEAGVHHYEMKATLPKP